MAAKDMTCFEAAAVAAPTVRWGDMEHNPEEEEEQILALAADSSLRTSEAVHSSKDEKEDKPTGTGEKQLGKEAPAGGSAIRAMLSLPTPARNQAAPRLPGLVSGGSAKASPSQSTSASKCGGATPSAAPSKPPRGPEPWGAAQDAAQGGATPSAAPSKPPRGPEPWGATQDATQGAASAKAGGYREYLQARGQQALQRSRLRGAPPPLTAAGVPPPPPGPPALAFDPSACGTPTGGWSPAMTPVGGSPTAVAAWGMPNEMQVHAAQPWMQTNAFGMPAAPPPAGARQPPYAPTLPLQQALPLQPQLPIGAVCGQQQQQPVMMDMAAQQGPPACGPSYPQVPPAAPRSSSNSCVGSPIGEDLMATFMPQAFAMDRDQLAEQLRAAASSCSYDD